MISKEEDACLAYLSIFNTHTSRQRFASYGCFPRVALISPPPANHFLESWPRLLLVFSLFRTSPLSFLTHRESFSSISLFPFFYRISFKQVNRAPVRPKTPSKKKRKQSKQSKSGCHLLCIKRFLVCTRLCQSLSSTYPLRLGMMGAAASTAVATRRLERKAESPATTTTAAVTAVSRQRPSAITL